MFQNPYIKYQYAALFVLLVCFGCKDASRPSDIPPLYPCVISVTQGGGPLTGAYVELVAVESSKYQPSSTTDDAGNATIMTYGYPGAPLGKYKIIIRKSIEDDIVYGKDEYGNQAIVSSNRYNVVNDVYADASRSPHEIEVVSGSDGVTLTVDVGEAIKVKANVTN